MTAEFTGKYRGKVRNNVDPLMLGRLIVSVPAVAEIPLSWAMPCVPYAGNRVGLAFQPGVRRICVRRELQRGLAGQ